MKYTNDAHEIWDFGRPRKITNDASEIWGSRINKDEEIAEGNQTEEEIIEEIEYIKITGKRDRRVGKDLRSIH